jgi:hypothetical protein
MGVQGFDIKEYAIKIVDSLTEEEVKIIKKNTDYFLSNFEFKFKYMDQLQTFEKLFNLEKQINDLVLEVFNMSNIHLGLIYKSSVESTVKSKTSLKEIEIENYLLKEKAYVYVFKRKIYDLYFNKLKLNEN